MKRRHLEAYRQDALAVLNWAKISVGQDFHTLAGWQVDRLLEEADSRKYQSPTNAGGSRARMFYERLQRRAQMRKETEK